MDDIDRLIRDMPARRAQAERLPEPLGAFICQRLLNSQETKLKELQETDGGEGRKGAGWPTWLPGPTRS